MNTETLDQDVRKLKRVKIGLLRIDRPEFALFRGILMVGKTQVKDDVPTAYTNGRDEVYGRAWVQSCSEKELAFTVLHENMHKIKRDLTTWHKLFKEDAKLANMACDYVDNLMLVGMDPNEEFIAPPRKDGKLNVLIDRRFAGMNVKRVFDILKKEQEEGGGGGGGGGEPLDEHGWEEAEDMSDEEKRDLDRDIEHSIREGQEAAKRAGAGAGNMDRLFEELLAPKVDWREQLREFVTSICRSRDTSSWRRVNRRYIGQDIYMPSMIGETIGPIVIGIDTSGSIGGSELRSFMSEVKAIAGEVRPERVHLMYWDTKVAAHEVYEQGQLDGLIASTKPKGGGGTDPTCVLDYIKQNSIKPECIIILTDGDVGNDWGTDWPAPVLWAIAGRKDIVAPNGKTIHIND
jgi:predicted metal-dependent peptidase